MNNRQLDERAQKSARFADVMGGIGLFQRPIKMGAVDHHRITTQHWLRQFDKPYTPTRNERTDGQTVLNNLLHCKKVYGVLTQREA